MDSPSTSVGLSERSLKTDQLPGDVCDACALSPKSMREGPCFSRKRVALLVNQPTTRDVQSVPQRGPSLLAADASYPQPQSERSK
jgi:hypothetical protein